MCIVTCISASANASTEWAQYKGNAQHTGYQAVTLEPNANIAWSANIAGGISGLAASNGKVYASSSGYFNNQSLTAISAFDGTQVWSKDFGAIYSVNPPSIANGIVYLQTGNHGSDTYLRGYSAEDGSLKFKSAFSAQWERYQSPTLYDGTAYINGGYYGGAYAFDLKTGNQDWFVGLEQYDGWTPAINQNHLVVYTGGNLRELDRETGATIQTIQSSSFSWSGWSSITPTLVDNTAYVSAGGNIMSFDLLTGKEGWKLSGVTSSLAVAQNEAFVIRNGAVNSLNATTGAINWLWEDSAVSNLGNDIIATDNLLIVSGGAYTYLLDRNSQQLLQRLDQSGQIALANNQLYIASNSNLYAYNIAVVPETSLVSMYTVGLFCLSVFVRRNRNKLPTKLS
jgi:outer membrane protein assembly factor BamB